LKFHEQPNVFVSHVHLKVTDLNKSLSFYQEIIGLRILKKAVNSAVLTADGYKSLITLTQPKDVTAKEPRRTGLYHFAMLLPSRSDLASCLKHLVESGYPLQGASDHLVSEAIYLGDPDGNGIEIYSDRPAEEWEWENGYVKMDTVALDVEDLFSQWGEKEWNGLPEATIMGHIHLHVANLQDAEEFYCKGLGFDIVTRYGGQALFISSGRYHHHIGLNTWNGLGAPAPSEKSAGLQDYTIVYPSEESRKEVLERLKELHYPVKMEEETVKVVDPSGTQVLLSL
jgi:catechol 2,3-dioxygenase